MRRLPSGTVTLLFTDIEASTRLLRELGDGYAGVLAEHRRALRMAFAAHDGVEVDTQGDAFFYAFESATCAVAAAADAQAALAGGAVTVRMGIHTGEPAVTEEGYVGLDVNRAARVMAVGHGGQVLLSKRTRDLLDPSFELRDLGEHRLKDLDEPFWIFQLGRRAFPPLKTPSNTNLPRPASSLVGRERELDEILALLRRSSVRLLTLTGPAGSGKTRLAIAAASELVPEYANGVFWVGLAVVRDPALVSGTVAETLGAKHGLAEHIGERELLLLLDNLEQVVQAAPELPQLLRRCPNLTLLVTSRERLRVDGEVEYEVPPLAPSEAVELFCERARIGRDADVDELCARLDSLPLALELAAARTKVLTPAQILERLSERLDALKGRRDADPRQQTLRAAIEWSHDLLTDEEKALFARLAVFAGGCTLDAAEHVAEADIDTLESLVEKSLVRRTGDRFWMLETIHAYAREQLAATGERDHLRERLAHFLLELVERLPAARGLGPGQAEAFARLEAEHPNVREAFDWAFERGEAELVVALASAEWHFLTARGHGAEADAWLRRALPLARSGSGAALSRAEYAASEIARHLGDLERAGALKRDVVSRARAGVAEAEQWLVPALSDLADIALSRGDLTAARGFAEEGVAASLHPGQRTRALSSLASVALEAGDLAEAERLLEEVAQEWKGRHEFNHAVSLQLLGEVAWRSRDAVAAATRFGRALRSFADLGDAAAAAECLVHLGAVEAAEGRLERAGVLLGAARALREEAGTQDDAPPPSDGVPPESLAEGASMSLEEVVEYAGRARD